MLAFRPDFVIMCQDSVASFAGNGQPGGTGAKKGDEQALSRGGGPSTACPSVRESLFAGY